MDKKKGAIMSLLNNPWFRGIIVGAIAGLLAGVVLFYLSVSRSTRITRTNPMSHVNNADQLLRSDEVDDALLKYEEVLREVSEAKYPDIYARIKHDQGICYTELARIADKEENLTKAIRAYEEALGIRTVEKYPVNYATTQNNLGNAYRVLAE